MSSGLYSHTTRGTGTVLTAAIYNSDHQNHITNQNPSMTGAHSDNVTQMQIKRDPGDLGSESLAPSLAGEIESLRFVLARLLGETHWYQPPDATIAALATGLFPSLGISGAVALTGAITPTQITADQHNYAPTGHATTLAFRLSADAVRTVTGLAGGVAGRVVVLMNVGANGIQIPNEDVNSTAANRFAIGSQGPIFISGGESAAFQYDTTSSRWRPWHNADVASPSFTNITVSGFTDLVEGAVPSNPAADIGRLYAKDVGGLTQLAYRDSAGREYVLDVIGKSELVAIIEDQKTSGTSPQSLTGGADNVRELNTLVYNRNSLVSLSSNQFTLPAGTWEIEWTAPLHQASASGQHQSRLYNVTDAAEVARASAGGYGNGDGGDQGTQFPSGKTVVTIAASKAFEIRHQTSSTLNGGAAGFFGTEVYTRVSIRRA